MNEKELATNVGISFTGVTVKEIFAVLELEPSEAIKTKFPKVLRLELAFSSELKEIFDN